MKHIILAGFLALSAVAAAPAAFAQTAPDYAAIVAAPDRSEADRKLDTNRAPAQWLAFIGAKPGMKILDIFAVYGWKAELLARAVAPGGKVYAQNSEAALARVKDRLDARLKTPAAANIVPVVRGFEDPAPPDSHDFDRVTFFYAYHDITNLGVDRARDEDVAAGALSLHLVPLRLLAHGVRPRQLPVDGHLVDDPTRGLHAHLPGRDAAFYGERVSGGGPVVIPAAPLRGAASRRRAPPARCGPAAPS